jgi:hypothetical protein
MEDDRLPAVAVPHTADVVGDAGIIADHVWAKVGFCIAATMQWGRDH